MGGVYFIIIVSQFKSVTFKILKQLTASGYHIGQHNSRLKEKILMFLFSQGKIIKILIWDKFMFFQTLTYIMGNLS